MTCDLRMNLHSTLFTLPTSLRATRIRTLVLLIVAALALVGNLMPVVHGAARDRAVWQTFSMADGLPSADTVAVDVADDGAVWVGYFAHGVSRYDNAWTHHATLNGLASDHVRALRAVGDDVWVGHTGGAYSRFGSGSGAWIAAVSPAGSNCGAITAIEPVAPYVTVFGAYPFGTLGNGGGVIELNELAAEMRRPPLPPVPLRAVTALSAGADGSVWVAARDFATVEGTLPGGVAWVTGRDVRLFTTAHGLPSQNVTDVLWSASGVWAATDAGLARYTMGRWQVVSAEFHTLNDLNAVALDVDGSLWVGMSWGAAHRALDGKWSFYTTDDGLAGNDVRDIAVQPDGSVWFATDQGVSVRYSAENDDTDITDPSSDAFTLYLPLTRR